MGRNKDCDYITYPLPLTSMALQDLDTYRQEWGEISRADATRQLLIAWSKAKHGDPGALALLGLPLSSMAAPPIENTSSANGSGNHVQPMENQASLVKKKYTRNGNADAVSLDL